MHVLQFVPLGGLATTPLAKPAKPAKPSKVQGRSKAVNLSGNHFFPPPSPLVDHILGWF